MSLFDLTDKLFVSRKKPTDESAQKKRPRVDLVNGSDDVVGICRCDAKPVWVTAELASKKETR
tara:strand:- start:10131 stop:10319 length:189 start_codon:yes stop_codon:yes gene_type:complete